MGTGGNSDYSIGHLRQQQIGEREVAEMVGTDLQLEAVRRTPFGRSHDAGVVDQHTELAPPSVRESAHGAEVGKIESANLTVAGNRLGGRLACDVAYGEHDTSTCLCERLRGGSPIPLLPPVTMKVRPGCDGRSAAVHRVEVTTLNLTPCRWSRTTGSCAEDRVVRDHFQGRTQAGVGSGVMDLSSSKPSIAVSGTQIIEAGTSGGHLEERRLVDQRLMAAFGEGCLTGHDDGLTVGSRSAATDVEVTSEPGA